MILDNSEAPGGIFVGWLLPAAASRLAQSPGVRWGICGPRGPVGTLVKSTPGRVSFKKVTKTSVYEITERTSGSECPSWRLEALSLKLRQMWELNSEWPWGENQRCGMAAGWVLGSGEGEEKEQSSSQELTGLLQLFWGSCWSGQPGIEVDQTSACRSSKHFKLKH